MHRSPASATPTRPRVTTDRLLWADLVRAAALLVVVFGHYLMAVVHIAGADVSVDTVLDATTWSHPVTWLLQVMGCFFAVGAVVAAPGLAERLAAQKGRDSVGRTVVWRDHVAARTRTLLVPALPLLALWAVAGPALRDRYPDDLVARASQAALVPLWFLAVYVVVHALIPVMVGVVTRVGVWRPVTGLLVAAAVVDVAHRSGMPAIGWLNFGLVWMVPTTVGVGVGLGRVDRQQLGRAAALGLVLALTAVAVAGYAVPVVGAADGGRSNNHPPSLLLGLHALAHSGAVLLIAPRLEGWLRASSARRALLRAAGRWSMPIYLWHMTGYVLLSVAVMAWRVPVVGATFALEPLSGQWWAVRPLQMGAALGVTAMVILLMSGPTTGVLRLSGLAVPPGPTRLAAGVVATSVGIGTTVWYGTAQLNVLSAVALVLAVVALHPRPPKATTGHPTSERLSK